MYNQYVGHRCGDARNHSIRSEDCDIFLRTYSDLINTGRSVLLQGPVINQKPGNWQPRFELFSYLNIWAIVIDVLFSILEYQQLWSLQCRHNGRDGVWNHQPHDCLLNRLSRRRSKKTSKLRVTGLCAGNSPITGEFPAKRVSDAENVFIWWLHHVLT